MIPLMLISSMGMYIIALNILYSPIMTDPASRIIADMLATKITYKNHDFIYGSLVPIMARKLTVCIWWIQRR